MSVIESPPEDRLPVETYVAEYDSGMIKEALERELRRGGRIYYVHNRITGLERIAGELRKLVPGISIRIAHGRMSEEMLEDAMIDFYEGNCDLLLSTTIIENGLDVPLANTIIIDGAENFGLSQLYQMRGRVGRSARLAYAYLCTGATSSSVKLPKSVCRPSAILRNLAQALKLPCAIWKYAAPETCLAHSSMGILPVSALQPTAKCLKAQLSV